jgi:peptidoglycan/LPS O-acetylase OafA/YrhL
VFIRLRLFKEEERMETFWDQILHWFRSFYRISDPWKWEGFDGMPYDNHLWTIPIEFGQSLILFVILLALSQLRTAIRFGLLGIIITFALRGGHWATVEYLAGMGIAEIGIIQEQSPKKKSLDMEPDLLGQPTTTSRSRLSAWTILYTTFLTTDVLLATYIMGWPFVEFAEQVPLFEFLLRHAPEPWRSYNNDNHLYIWMAWSAVQVVFVVHQWQFLQKAFTTSFAQYLARISYSLYLVHGTILFTFVQWMMPRIWGLVGENPGFW